MPTEMERDGGRDEKHHHVMPATLLDEFVKMLTIICYRLLSVHIRHTGTSLTQSGVAVKQSVSQSTIHSHVSYYVLWDAKDSDDYYNIEYHLEIGSGTNKFGVTKLTDVNTCELDQKTMREVTGEASNDQPSDTVTLILYYKSSEVILIIY